MENLLNKKNKDKVFFYDYRIKSFDVDFRKQLTIPSIFKIFQEAAYHHAKKLNFGYEDMIKEDMFWVLSLLKIEIYKYPKWRDRITIKTWPSGVDRIFVTRDFEIKNEPGSIIAASTSSWLVLDINSKRPKRSSQFLEAFPDFYEKRALSQNPQKISSLDKPKKGKSFIVNYSDIDLNDHLNNTKYIEWILDNYSKNFFKNYEIKNLEINFLSESSWGDNLIVCEEVENSSQNIIKNSLLRDKDKKDVCRTSISWVKKIKFI